MTKGKARRGTRHKNRLDRLLNLLGSFLRRNVMIIRSLVIFVGIILAFVLAAPLYRPFVNGPLPMAIAHATHVILRLFGTPTQLVGTTIESPLFSMEVVSACTGIFAYMLFAAAVFAYPCKLKAKAIGIAIGVPVIFTINLVRVVSLFYIGAYAWTLFDIAHQLFWQVMMVVSVVLLWLFWARRWTHVRS